MSLDDFTAWLHEHIRETLAEDSHRKHYEGEMHVCISDVFTSPRAVELRLLMYVIAPDGREHTWSGPSVSACCELAHADIMRWLAERDAS